MYKAMQLLKRGPEISPAYFKAAWTFALEAPRPAGLIRHVHNSPLGANSPIQNATTAEFDGADELWFEDEKAAVGYFESSFHRDEWLASRRQLLDRPDPEVIAGPSRTIIEEASTDRLLAGVKLVILARRRADFTRQQFHDYWVGTHIPLAMNGSHTRERLLRLELCLPTNEPMRGVKLAPFDGASAMIFESAAALQAEFEGDYYRTVLAVDEPRFSDSANSRALLVEETTLYAR
jgi:hypothetical protein